MPKQKIFVAGHNGMVGSAIIRELESKGFSNILSPRRSDLDLTSQSRVNDYFSYHKPNFVFLAAAKVGGINANNTHKGEFIYENIMIQSNGRDLVVGNFNIRDAIFH